MHESYCHLDGTVKDTTDYDDIVTGPSMTDDPRPFPA